MKPIPKTCPLAVMQATAEEFGLHAHWLYRPTSKQVISWPRAVACYVMHHRGLSQPRIGRALNMLSSSIYSAVGRVNNRLHTGERSYAALPEKIQRILDRIDSRKQPVESESLRSVAEWCKSYECHVMVWAMKEAV